MAPRKRRSTTCGASFSPRVRRARMPSLRAREAEGELPGRRDGAEGDASPSISPDLLSSILARMEELDAKMDSVISASDPSGARRPARPRRSEASSTGSMELLAQGSDGSPATGGELVIIQDTQPAAVQGTDTGLVAGGSGPADQPGREVLSVSGDSSREATGAVCSQVWSAQVRRGNTSAVSSLSLAPSGRDPSPRDPLSRVGPEAIPWGDIETPLSYHLLPATKEKIWKGEYIDIFTLLNREQPKKDKEEEKDKEAVKKPKVEKCFSSWLYAFLIYHSVVVEKQVNRTHELLKYQDIVVRTYYEFGGTAWLQYDEAFRMRAALRPLRWDERRLDLWLQATQLSKASGALRTDSGHYMPQGAGTTQSPRPTAGPGVRMPQLCFEFSSKGSCSRNACRFRHGCGVCGGFHATSICSRARGPRNNKGQAASPRPQQGQPQNKGAQPN